MKTPKRLAGNLQVPGSATTEYTVPASTKTIVRHLHVANPSGSAVTFTLSIGVASSAANRLYDAVSIPPNSVLGGPGGVWLYAVMEAAEVIQVLAGTATTLVLFIDGDEYTLG